MIRPLAALALCAAAPAAAADGLDLTPAQRAAFGAEVRALLMDEPALAAPALKGAAPDAASIYADEAASDRARIAADAGLLFTPGPLGFGADKPKQTIALFLSADCADCAPALRDLIEIAAHRPGLRVELRALDADPATLSLMARIAQHGPDAFFDSGPGADAMPIAGDAGAGAAARLGLDLAPSYVLPDMMLRGWIPAIVLDRYLDRD